jgi:hypothetical protein
MKCLCSAPGFCPTFNKQQSPRQWRICRNEIAELTAEECEIYRLNWGLLASPPEATREPFPLLDLNRRPDVVEAYRQRFNAAVDNLQGTSYPAGFAGRGIVTLGGSSKYFLCAYLLVTALREVGCQLPVEWWYLDYDEMDPQMISLAESLGNVTCVNLRERLAAHARTVRSRGGWEAKVWSIMYSKFREVLFLDADQLPVRDPTFLFDSSEYVEAGAVFWPDHPPMGWSIAEQAFVVAGLPVPGRTKRSSWAAPTDYTPFESGQVLIDKSRHWPPLELTAYINDNSNFWFPRHNPGRDRYLIYGDKDTFYLAWNRLGVPYAMPPACRFAGDREIGAFIQHDFAGNAVFQHRVNPHYKWRLHTPNKPFAEQAHVALCNAVISRLQQQWSGQVYSADAESARERALAARAKCRIVVVDGQPLELINRQFAARGGRRHWTVREVDGRPRLLVCDDDKILAGFGEAATDWIPPTTPAINLDPPNFQEHNRHHTPYLPAKGLLRAAQRTIGHEQHRSGWKYAISRLDPQRLPLLLDDFTEQNFCYALDRLTYDKPWVGIFHHPQRMPAFSEDRQKLDVVWNLPEFQASLLHLRGVIVLSEYLAHWWRQRVQCPVCVLKHPSEVPDLRWSPERFTRNPAAAIIQVGYYLRNTLAIDQVRVAGLRRVRLMPNNTSASDWHTQCIRLWQNLRTREHFPGVEELSAVPDQAYDELLSANIVLTEVFDASANNVVIECIARNTPLVVNRHPAVVEYLGPDYPLFFDRIEELFDLSRLEAMLGYSRVVEQQDKNGLLTTANILAAHRYLTAQDKAWLSVDYFTQAVHAFMESVA